MSGRKMVFGYKRVSTTDQSFDRQDLGDVDRIFEEKISGNKRDRPELDRLLDLAREGDEIVVYSIDRLARDMFDLLDIVRGLRERQIGIRFLKENLTFCSDAEKPIEKLQFHMMSAFAEFERSIIRERQREGIEKAKAKDKYRGRPPGDHREVEELLEMTDISIAEICRKTGRSRMTVYRTLKQMANSRAELRIQYKLKTGEIAPENFIEKAKKHNI